MKVGLVMMCDVVCVCIVDSRRSTVDEEEEEKEERIGGLRTNGYCRKRAIVLTSYNGFLYWLFFFFK